MKRWVNAVSAGVLAAGLCISVLLVRAVMAGDRLYQPLRAKYGKLSDFEWYCNDEARTVFHGPGPTGDNSWLIYFAGFITLLVVGAMIMGAIGLSFRASRQVRAGGVSVAVIGIGTLVWMWASYGESIEAISSVVE
ncbi:hypothetical protein [Haloferula sp.]|uniref:hypothetical protein n=1 Tax=Haloferula sp. TaxID=2497595 RepID=UPI00329B62E5